MFAFPFMMIKPAHHIKSKPLCKPNKHLHENLGENVAKTANISAIKCVFSVTIH